MGSCVSIIGAGLAGSEAALQLAESGYSVKIYEAKPYKLLPAYKLTTLAELVCNNSLGEFDVSTPLGMLLSEVTAEGSKLIAIAKNASVQDDKRMGVDVSSFSRSVSKALDKLGIKIISEELNAIPDERPLIIATGALTNDKLADSISKKFNIPYSQFSDACCPIIDINTINLNNEMLIKKSDDIYEINIDENCFESFFETLKNGEYPTHQLDTNFSFNKIFTIEALANRGISELRSRFITKEGNIILILRRESALSDGFILEGCTTMLNNRSQKRAFSMLPGFSLCKFIRFGRMHRNTFFHSPGHIDSFFNIVGTEIFLIGQISGIDGYTAAISSGIIAAKRIINGSLLRPYPTNTMMGALAKYVSNTNVTNYQPMGASLSLLSK